jgi:hypothetical protein
MYEKGIKQLRFTEMWYSGRVSGELAGGMRIIELGENREKEYLIARVGRRI